MQGYDETVIPQIVNAVLARHDFILLGLRGQAKSRILRQLVELLDRETPILAGSEVNDDPLRPISKYARQLLAEQGDDAPIEWVDRDHRYVEKLATPDVTIADMIGDVDPIKAARGGHILADELTIHYGLLPRANRGIFAINELPDLAGKIQVGLFNILQEGDVQVKGYPIRLALDVMMVFTANPEDYTARGKIITPLKDRIGAEIRTHYPEVVEIGMDITRQEAWVDRDGLSIEVPDFVQETVELIAFLARADKRVDHRSGVSQRMPITVMETIVSNAERRALRNGEDRVVPRIADIYQALPAITGQDGAGVRGRAARPRPDRARADPGRGLPAASPRAPAGPTSTTSWSTSSPAGRCRWARTPPRTPRCGASRPCPASWSWSRTSGSRRGRRVTACAPPPASLLSRRWSPRSGSAAARPAATPARGTRGRRRARATRASIPSAAAERIAARRPRERSERSRADRAGR